MVFRAFVFCTVLRSTAGLLRLLLQHHYCCRHGFQGLCFLHRAPIHCGPSQTPSSPTSLLLSSWFSGPLFSGPCSDPLRAFSDSFFSCRAAATVPGFGLAVVFPFELGSGVPELLPMPLDMGAAELIGGIIPIEYMAIRLGSLNILGSMPMLASTFGSIPIMLIILGSGAPFGSNPMLASILGSMPASILGSIPIILIILGSIPGIDLATFLGSMAAARVLGSNPICAMRLGSLSILGSSPMLASIFGSIPIMPNNLGSGAPFGSNPMLANILGSIPASIFGSIPIMLIILGSTAAGIDLATFFGSKAAARVLGSSPICARTLGSIPLIMLGSIPAAASIFGSMPATKSADLEDELGGGKVL